MELRGVEPLSEEQTTKTSTGLASIFSPETRIVYNLYKI